MHRWTAVQPQVTWAAAQQESRFNQERFERLWWQQFEDPVLGRLVASTLESNRAEREQLAAEDVQAEAEVELYRGILALYRALGGSWQPS